jgi:hypothetical protein
MVISALSTIVHLVFPSLQKNVQSVAIFLVRASTDVRMYKAEIKKIDIVMVKDLIQGVQYIQKFNT